MAQEFLDYQGDDASGRLFNDGETSVTIGGTTTFLMHEENACQMVSEVTGDMDTGWASEQKESSFARD